MGTKRVPCARHCALMDASATKSSRPRGHGFRSANVDMNKVTSWCQESENVDDQNFVLVLA